MLEGCIGFGLPWDPTQISREFGAGGSGRSENFVGDPLGMVGFGVIEMESTH